MSASSSEPERIERLGETGLKIRWSDGHESLYTWSALRQACPCAMCRQGEPPKPDPAVKPSDLQAVGRYALTVRWSDGHSTGIYSHEYLRSLCSCEACRPTEFTEG